MEDSTKRFAWYQALQTYESWDVVHALANASGSTTSPTHASTAVSRSSELVDYGTTALVNMSRSPTSEHTVLANQRYYYYSCSSRPRFQNTRRGYDGPIMDLSAHAHKGMTNQLSASIGALYLAAILRWDVLLPAISSPLHCAGLTTSCYQYEKFKTFHFKRIYDEYHAVRMINLFLEYARTVLALWDTIIFQRRQPLARSQAAATRLTG